MHMPMNPFQLNELILDQSTKALQGWFKLAEQNDKLTTQMLDFSRKSREDSVKMLETNAEQMKQSTRLLTGFWERMINLQMQNYQQASKTSVEQINKQVAQFSKQ